MSVRNAKNNLDPQDKKTIFYSVLVVIGLAITIIVLSNVFSQETSDTENGDFPNWLTLVAEIAVGLFIAIIVNHKTAKSEKFITSTLAQLYGIEKKQEKHRGLRKETSSIQIQQGLQSIHQNCMSMKGYLKKMDGSKDTDLFFKKTLGAITNISNTAHSETEVLDPTFTFDINRLLLHINGMKLHYDSKNIPKMKNALNDAIEIIEKLLNQFKVSTNSFDK